MSSENATEDLDYPKQVHWGEARWDLCTSRNWSSALLFGNVLVNKAEASAQSRPALPPAHRATPAPGSICSPLSGLQGRLELFHQESSSNVSRETSQEETDNAAPGIKAHALQFLHLLLVQRKEKKNSKPEALRNQRKTKHFFSLQLCEIQTIIL